MDFTLILISMASMGGLGLLFSAGLSIADKKLHVEEDPLIGKLIDALPGANCAACGYVGCANFAEGLARGESAPAACPVSSPEQMAVIAGLLGVESQAGNRLVARLMCQGGDAETAKKAFYAGARSCIGASFSGGGDRMCSYGCIGYGDCVTVCPFDAMYMNENGLPVILEDKCTGCGKCVVDCPRDILELHPINRKLFILCKNEDPARVARKVCLKACTGCKLCVKGAGEQNIRIDSNLAIINYEVFGLEPELPTEKCPGHALVIFDSDSSAAWDSVQKSDGVS